MPDTESRAKSLPMIGLLVVMAAPAGALDWGELDCKVVLDALQAQTLEAAILRMNAQVLETSIRGRDYYFFEESILPQLKITPTDEKDRALGLVNALIRDRCPSQ
jgi:hypothetical protein